MTKKRKNQLLKHYPNVSCSKCHQVFRLNELVDIGKKNVMELYCFKCYYLYLYRIHHGVDKK